MKFIEHKSSEKSLINTTFNSVPYMDIWISSIVEGYIYEKVNKPDIIGHIHEYVERYGKKEGYWKIWHPNGQLWV